MYLYVSVVTLLSHAVFIFILPEVNLAALEWQARINHLQPNWLHSLFNNSYRSHLPGMPRCTVHEYVKHVFFFSGKSYSGRGSIGNLSHMLLQEENSTSKKKQSRKQVRARPLMIWGARENIGCKFFFPAEAFLKLFFPREGLFKMFFSSARPFELWKFFFPYHTQSKKCLKFFFLKGKYL